MDLRLPGGDVVFSLILWGALTLIRTGRRIKELYIINDIRNGETNLWGPIATTIGTLGENGEGLI
jgi:hypothetical protein